MEPGLPSAAAAHAKPVSWQHAWRPHEWSQLQTSWLSWWRPQPPALWLSRWATYVSAPEHSITRGFPRSDGPEQARSAQLPTARLSRSPWRSSSNLLPARRPSQLKCLQQPIHHEQHAAEGPDSSRWLSSWRRHAYAGLSTATSATGSAHQRTRSWARKQCSESAGSGTSPSSGAGASTGTGISKQWATRAS